MIYLDASVIAPLFVPEADSQRAEALIAKAALMVSDLGAAEFSSAVARGVRMRTIPRDEAAGLFSDFDLWAASLRARVQIESADFAEATNLVRRIDLGLRTPDALHIAVAQRLGATLATFDARLAAAATALGVPVVG